MIDYCNKKKCSRCKKEKPVDDFIKQGMYRSSKCNPCRLEYQKKINKKRKITKLW